MVWIHEGNFANGSGDVSIKKPDFLLMRDVLFVSMNYRLGAVGFASLNERHMTGNLGLKDQNMALKWVQTNIAKFGGNPNKVTIFGKGAGAVSVGLHVLSRASRGLFHGAISMSGTPLDPHSFVSLSEAVRRGEKLFELTKKSKYPAEGELRVIDLEAVSFEELLKKSQLVDPIAPFVPTIETPHIADLGFLYTSVNDIYESREFTKVPQILGSTHADISVYSNFIKQTIRAKEESFSRDMNLRSLKGAIKRCFDNGGDVSSFRINWIGSYPMPNNVMLFYNPVSDTRRFLVGGNGNNPVYVYNFIFPPYGESASTPETSGVNIDTNNAAFAEDLDHIFYIPSKNPYPSANPEINRMIDIVCGMWTDFAKYGDPTPDRVNEDMGYWNWPACDAFYRYDVTKTLEISPNMSIRSGGETELIDCINHPRAGRLCYYFES